MTLFETGSESLLEKSRILTKKVFVDVENFLRSAYVDGDGGDFGESSYRYKYTMVKQHHICAYLRFFEAGAMLVNNEIVESTHWSENPIGSVRN